MLLEFEIWYKQNITDKHAIELFNESCTCYKVGAYRAAFLMSYLGLQSLLKEKLKNSSKKPEKITKEYWEQMLNKLEDDTAWDDTVFKNVNKSKPDNPFLIDDDIRKQYSYFRVIRNDCAHAKSNIIRYSHIEILWLFIQSNYNKFVVNGGKAGLLERIKVHFNSMYTKPNSDITPIIESIVSAMEIKEIPIFFKDVYDLLGKCFWKNSFDNNEKCFWKQIVFSNNEQLREAMWIFIKSNWNIMLEFIDKYPDKLMEILSGSESVFVREFWNDKVFKMLSWEYENGWEIIEILLRNNIIPKEEQENFINKLINKETELPPEDKIDYFKTTVYFDNVKKNIFGIQKNFNYPNGINYANDNWNKIKILILNIKLDYEIVSQLNSIFLRVTYGKFYEGLLELLETNNKFRDKYKEILETNSLEYPTCIVH